MSPDIQQAADTTPSSATTVINVRFPLEDLEQVRRAARYQSLSLSSYVRAAALADAREVNQHAIAS